MSNLEQCFPIDLKNNWGKLFFFFFQSVTGSLETRTLPLFCKGRVRPPSAKNTPPIIKQGGWWEWDADGAHTGSLVVARKFTSPELKPKLVFGPLG